MRHRLFSAVIEPFFKLDEIATPGADNLVGDFHIAIRTQRRIAGLRAGQRAVAAVDFCLWRQVMRMRIGIAEVGECLHAD